MDSQFDMFFVIVIVSAAAFIVYSISKKINETILDSRVPVLEIPVKVIEKRVLSGNRNKHHSRTIFKVTFEDLDTSERHTFSISETEFDEIVEDDIGYLKFQRKRYHTFQRDELAAEFEDETSGPLRIDN